MYLYSVGEDMITIGVKLTHDAAVALIKDNQLIFSVEAEKMNNNDRYAPALSEDFILDVLHSQGFNIQDVDDIVLDGWVAGHSAFNRLRLGSYNELNEKSLHCISDTIFESRRYSSYPHVTGHILGAYMTSPFSKKMRPAASLIWDGRQPPRVDIVNPNLKYPIKHIGTISVFRGYIYGIMGYYFGPYKDMDVISGKNYNDPPTNPLLHSHGIPGKLMSYIGLGKVDVELKAFMTRIYNDVESFSYGSDKDYTSFSNMHRGDIEHFFMRSVYVMAKKLNCLDPDVLATVHQFIEELIVRRLVNILPEGMPLIYSGGCALNIKWNSAIYNSGHFEDVYIPPFANDSGSAIGAACCKLAHQDNLWSIDWSVYSGPEIINDEQNLINWESWKMSPMELGFFLSINPGEAVVTLSGRAEIGPRALGHRSILMCPEKEEAKHFLNNVKKREAFRPVAPIALEEDAKKYFHLTKNDKYMLFDSELNDEIDTDVHLLKALRHLDGTARVQCVSKEDCSVVYEILSGYKLAKGYGILCNTSANYLGKGFFPSLSSAANWCNDVGVNFIWCNGTMHKRKWS